MKHFPMLLLANVFTNVNMGKCFTLLCAHSRLTVMTFMKDPLTYFSDGSSKMVRPFCICTKSSLYRAPVEWVLELN